MASWPGTAPRTGGPSSSAASSRAGGGSLSDLVLLRTGVAMRKELRLRRRKEFDSVFRRGRIWANDLLVVRTLPNELEHNRYGFVISKRLGKAVTRNRVRRRLREGIRSLSLRPGWDVVISGKTPASQAGFQELKRAVVELFGSAGILDREPPPGEARS